MNGGDAQHDDNMDLLSLLSQTVSDWAPIYAYIIENNAEKLSRRNYRNETPLQLALRVKERMGGEEEQIIKGGKPIKRIDVLQALVDADPASIFERDNDGKSALHTACGAGCSREILRWLIKAEEHQLSRKKNEGQRMATLRTDYPGGALPLHSVAACPTFDCSSFASDSATYPIQCSITSNILSAYDSTTIIWKAHPQAVWGRDCEGELPIHAAASYGNVGSVLSLLIGAATSSNCGARNGTNIILAKAAALAEDDRKKTPLDRACQRVCSMCVHELSHREPSAASFRQSISREDPFSEGINSNEGRRSLLRSSRVGSGRRRIPGCGSSFRTSFSGLPGDPLALTDSTRLRESFISPRRQIDPIRGFEPLDSDGDEEFAKVEMLARAACGFFDIFDDNPFTETPATLLAPPPETTIDSDKPTTTFRLLHSAIALGCAPEIIWHAADKNPDHVTMKDECMKTPLLLACERLAAIMNIFKQALLVTNKKVESTEIDEEQELDNMNEVEEDTNSNEDDTSDSDRDFVQFLLLGSTCPPLENTHPPTQSIQQPQLPLAEAENKPQPFPDDVREQISLSQEVINLLLYSQKFGSSEMASVPNSEGRLPLHLLLDAGIQYGATVAANDDTYGSGLSSDSKCSNLLQALIDACPQSLEIPDGKTRLLPFMLAALSSNEIQEGCTKQLDIVYQLLLEAPNAISVCL